MSTYTYTYQQAADNFRNGRYSRWFGKEEQRTGKEYMTERLGGVFLPEVNFHTTLRRTASLFTMGSCFARGLERAAKEAGMNATSLNTQRYLGPNIVTGYVNRYNTASLLNELRWASGEPFNEDSFMERKPGRFIDAHSHPVVDLMELDELRDLRTKLNQYFKHALSADVVTITLGLIEGWFDKLTGSMLNLNPVYGRDDGGRQLLDGDRFEFRVMSHAENMANLEKIYQLLTTHNPKVKIIVSVSPVPLAATFSHRDVAIANMLSKSMLRSCAETWVGRHPDIQYFPSYEMAVLSDPAIVYKEDRIHIQEDFVRRIMSHFMEHCVEAP